jgi:hypothetical protein
LSFHCPKFQVILRDWSKDAVSMLESGELTVEQLSLNSQPFERAVFWLFVSVQCPDC